MKTTTKFKKKMIRNWNIKFAFSVLLLFVHLLHITDGVTEKAVPFEAPNTTLVPSAITQLTAIPTTTTIKPKIDILKSALCRRCLCETEYLQIDCSNRSFTELFSEEEWQTLLNGDIIFETIKLNLNKISHIPVLPEYPVKSLHLSFNQIKNISMGAFQNLKHLKVLDLSKNWLTSKILAPHIFKGHYATDKYEPLPSMKMLDLSYNELHTLHSDLFEHLPNLDTLILSKNIFRVIDTSTLIAIASLSSLKILDLSYMELSKIPETIFHSPIELETLVLSGNLFHTLPEALHKTRHLKTLVLDENPLDNLENDNIFKSLDELEYLSISYLPDIEKIGAGAFSNLQNLTTLVAGNNPHLSHIHEAAFSKNTTNPDILDYPPLQKLYLHNNNLTTVDRNWIVRWDKVTSLDLRFNPWACDCRNRWLIHSLIQQINNTTPWLTHNIECASPSAWKGKPLLQLSGNNKELICENANHPEHDSLILVGILIGVLIGIPITLGGLFIYKKNYFGLLNRFQRGTDRPVYNQANFGDEL